MFDVCFDFQSFNDLLCLEFIEVQNKNRALEILCDVLHSKKHRTWQKKHEEIMLKYLELCVELKQSYVAKEGIYQYKIICQQSYISSFEEVIRKYIEMAEAKAEQAKEESQANIAEIDDLENAQTPEDILMSAVSNEQAQDRKDRVVLIPWVKFLWESYRQCLDLLRHNNKTERLYHDIAHQAFKFCIKYNRKSEFRKLCDNLHLHLDQLKRSAQSAGGPPSNSINLASPETQALQLETRLFQLDYAIQLELWQEAYKATDDIKKFNLMSLNKKGLGKPNLIASYYQKLALVFWKSHSPLFHAAALFRLFHLMKELRKNLTPEEVQKMASRLVLATLSIPIPPIRPEIDKLVDTEENVIEQHHRNLSSLLGITTKPPTRSSLIVDLRRMGVLQYASQPMQDLFNVLEVEFNPMGLCGRVQAIVDYLEKATADPATATELLETRQYISQLKEVTVIRLVREVAQIYKSIEFGRLHELCPFVDSILLEKIVVESARRNDLQVRVDHRKGCYIFGTELRVSTGDEFIEGPHLQSMPNEQMRRQLVSMYSSLQKAWHLIDGEAIRKQREEQKRVIMEGFYKTAEREHRRILDRQTEIEKRKEIIEQTTMQREMEERKRQEEELLKRTDAERARLLEENRERERVRRQKDELELRKQMTMDQLKKMKAAMPELEFEGMNEEELAALKPQDIQLKRVEQLEKERRETLSKQRKVERKVDHFERAKRKEEIELLEQEYQESRVKDRQIWEECEKLRIEAAKEERKIAEKERERFRQMLGDKQEFMRRVLETREQEHQQRLKDFEKIVATEKVKRLEQRREKRIEERRVRFYKEKEEAERKRRQEVEAAEREHQNQLAAIQAKRQAEVDEKWRQEREAALASKRGEPSEGGTSALAWRSSVVRKADAPSPPPLPGQGSADEPPPFRSFLKGDRDRDREPPPMSDSRRSNYGGRSSGNRPRDEPPPMRGGGDRGSEAAGEERGQSALAWRSVGAPRRTEASSPPPAPSADGPRRGFGKDRDQPPPQPAPYGGRFSGNREPPPMPSRGGGAADRENEPPGYGRNRPYGGRGSQNQRYGGRDSDGSGGGGRDRYGGRDSGEFQRREPRDSREGPSRPRAQVPPQQ